MNLIYLHAQNLGHTLFMKTFCAGFRPEGPTLLLHDHFGREADTRFVTKRISALLSEGMVVNHAFSGDQRELLHLEETQITVRDSLIRDMMRTASLLILNPLAHTAAGTQAASALAVMQALRSTWPDAPVQVFLTNARSPLAQQPPEILTEADWQEQRAVYDEESATLDAAWHMRPARIRSTRELQP